jgi:hypothetical protein
LDGDLVRPGGAVGLPCPGVVGGAGVIVGVLLLVGVDVEVVTVGVVVGTVVGRLGRSEDVGVPVGSVVRVVSPGFGVVVVSPVDGVTRVSGWCLPACGSGISGVSTRGPPTRLLTRRIT